MTMKTATRQTSSEVEVWLRILYPDGKLPTKAARAILDLSFPPGKLERVRELSAKASAGTLTLEEDLELSGIERADAMLSILKSKARQVLKRNLR
jgi:hypothetical protein